MGPLDQLTSVIGQRTFFFQFLSMSGTIIMLKLVEGVILTTYKRCLSYLQYQTYVILLN